MKDPTGSAGPPAPDASSFWQANEYLATWWAFALALLIALISVILYFRRKYVKLKENYKKLEDVITTTARLQIVSDSTQVCVQVNNLSEKPKNISIEAKIISAEDEQNPFIRAITLPDSKKNLQMLGKAMETLDVAKLISSRKGPGKAICVIEVKSHDNGESFSRSLPLN